MKLIIFLYFLSINLNAKNATVLLRSDNTKGFNIPFASKLLDSSPVSSPRGDVAIYVPIVKDTLKPSVWFKAYNQKRGLIKWHGLQGETLSELGITKKGDVCFVRYDKDLFIKSFIYIKDDWHVYTINQIPKTWTHASPLPKNKEFNCYFNVKNFDGTKHIVKANFLDQTINSVYTPNPIVSYLFTPVSNFSGQLFFKERIGNKGEMGDHQPDQLIMWADKVPTLLLSDKDDDKSSSLYEFSHLISANSKGDLSFYANNYHDLIIFNSNKQLKKIPLPDEGNIELFTPVINDQKQLVIRHTVNNNNHISLWNSNTAEWNLLVKEHQTIPGDIGPLTIQAHLGPAFAGALSISDKYIFVQAHFVDYKGFSAGEGLIQIEL